MNSNTAESLNLPDLRPLWVGALALSAAFTLHTGRLDADHYQPSHPVAPKVLTAEPADGTGVNYQPAQPTPEPDQTGQPQEAQLEQGVPTIIQNYIDRNAVVINRLECSGALIRNAEGVPVGALTAEHCVDSPAEGQINPLVKDSDGNEYMVSSGPVTLESGIDTSSLQPIGNVQEFVVPALNQAGGSMDQALAVLPGYSPQQVIKDYRREQLSPRQINQLTPNKTTIWLAGYPYTQEGDDAGNNIRQEFPTQYIGEDLALTDFGKLVDLVSATDKTDSNGAICSWKISGSEGLVERTIHPAGGAQRRVVRSVGNMSVFASFAPLQGRGGQSVSQADAEASAGYYHENFPGTQWDGVAAVCSFAYEAIGKAHKIIYVAPSLDAVLESTSN